MEAKTVNTVDDPSSARFTWRVDNFSTLNTQKLYSESFYVGEHKWRLLIFPKGNNVDHLSIYLDSASSVTLPSGWSKFAQFSLSVINQIDNKSTKKQDFKHRFNARERDWGGLELVPLSELYDPGRGYLVNDTCVVEADFPGFRSVELKVEAAKTASGRDETSNSSSQGDIDGRIRQNDSDTDTTLPQTDTSGPPPASKSATEVIKSSVPPATPIVEKESMVNSSHAQDPEVELPRSLPMGSPLESSSFDDMDAYTSKLVSVVETDAHFDSTTEGSVVASIPQSTVDEAKKFFIKMLSRDLSEIPDFAAHITESIRVLSECHDLTPAQLAQLKSLKVEFPSVLKTLTSNHSFKEVEEKIAEKRGTQKCLVEQVKINAFAFQMQRAIHKDLISEEAKLQQEVERLQAELAKISEKKKSAGKEMKQLHGKMVNLEQSRSSVLEEISTLETEKTAESSLSWVQQMWTELRDTFMIPNN